MNSHESQVQNLFSYLWLKKYSSNPDTHIKGSRKSSVHYIGSYAKIKWHSLTMMHHLHIFKHGQTITSGRPVSHLTYKYKSICFLHSNIHNVHDSTHPQGMHSVIIYGMNPRRCLFSTHPQLEPSCIIDNVFIFKIRNIWNTLLSFSRRTKTQENRI